MFSNDYISDGPRNLPSEDFKQYYNALDKIESICNSYEKTHSEDEFWALHTYTYNLSEELARCRADLISCRTELDAEKEKIGQLDIGRLHTALVFSSLSAALFIAFLPSYDPVFFVIGTLVSAILPLILWYFSYGIVQYLYNHYPEMFLMHTKKDKKVFGLSLILPSVFAIFYQFIKFWATK